MTRTGEHTKDPTSLLSTLALLKANYDAGRDYIEMFLPLVVDAISNVSAESFTVQEIADALTSRLHFQVPHNTVRTLLSRGVRRGFLRREFGRYWPVQEKLPKTDLVKELDAVKREQLFLGQQFVEYLQARKISVAGPEEALEMIFDFLERNHVAMLLDDPQSIQPDMSVSATTPKSSRLVARFIQEQITPDRRMTGLLEQILQGYVLQKALLLKDISQVKRQFKAFRIYLDTRILLQALGYQGESAKEASREMLQMLRRNGATIEAFYDTAWEIKRMLELYRNRIGTSHGRESLDQNQLTRFFLSNHWTPSDIVDAIATLEMDIQTLGIPLRQRPPREKKYTLGEEKLSQRLAKSGDPTFEPRVWHDVDCVAAILTLRKGLITDNLDDARAIFVTSTGLVVKNVTEWWREQIEGDQLTTDSDRMIPPVIHQIAISNYAWLKNPAFTTSLKLHELTALCYVALQPSKAAWNRFISHLKKLKESGKVTSEEIAVIMASNLTQSSLAEAEEESDLDACSLDEVVDRVKSSYAAQTIAATDKARLAEQSRHKLELRIANNADRLARGLTSTGFGVWALIVAVSIYFSPSSTMWRVLLYIFTFMNLVFGVFVYQNKSRVEARCSEWLRNWLLGRRDPVSIH